MGFFSRLERRAKEIDSVLCIGLDPHLEQLTKPEPQAVQDFCIRIIESTSDIALAYKPNIAFFEVFGSQGIAALEKVIRLIPEQIPIILDAKRGDIASSAQAYATAVFGALGVDAVTINPYLGYDALSPFIQDEDKGVFLLCKTSNPGSQDLQDRQLRTSHENGIPKQNETLYELIAAKAVEWNVMDNLGLVVGATQVEALLRVRNIAPNLWILAPGIGAQGGNLELALRAGLRQDGLGMVIPVSRAISKAPNPHQAAINLNDRINRQRKKTRQNTQLVTPGQTLAQNRKKLAVDILQSGCVKFGDFTLKSGISSPIYIDLRRLIGFPELLVRVGNAFSQVLRSLQFDHLAALPYAGLPIGTAVSLARDWSMVYPRKETKSYGTHAEVEGVFTAGDRVVLIDDLATTGGSKFEAIEKLNAVGLTVKDVVVLIDRESGASEDLSKSGYQLHAIFTLTELLQHWHAEGLITQDQVEKIGKFLQETR